MKEWLKDGAILHIMRDNPVHSAEILAGMWGIRLYPKIRQKLKAIVIEMIRDSTGNRRFDYDQLLLYVSCNL